MSFLAILGHFSPPPLEKEQEFCQGQWYWFYIRRKQLHICVKFEKRIMNESKVVDKKVVFYTFLGPYDAAFWAYLFGTLERQNLPKIDKQCSFRP